jgi:hypothetical protein
MNAMGEHYCSVLLVNDTVGHQDVDDVHRSWDVV